jgi:hypothetical protein
VARPGIDPVEERNVHKERFDTGRENDIYLAEDESQAEQENRTGLAISALLCTSMEIARAPDYYATSYAITRIAPHKCDAEPPPQFKDV